MSNSSDSELELLLEKNRLLKELKRKQDAEIKELLEENRRLKELDRKQDAEIEELLEENRRLKELDRKQDAEIEELNAEQNEKKRALETEIADQPPAKQLKSDTTNQKLVEHHESPSNFETLHHNVFIHYIPPDPNDYEQESEVVERCVECEIFIPNSDLERTRITVECVFKTELIRMRKILFHHKWCFFLDVNK